jgi:hypothetical protein
MGSPSIIFSMDALPFKAGARLPFFSVDALPFKAGARLPFFSVDALPFKAGVRLPFFLAWMPFHFFHSAIFGKAGGVPPFPAVCQAWALGRTFPAVSGPGTHAVAYGCHSHHCSYPHQPSTPLPLTRMPPLLPCQVLQPVPPSLHHPAPVPGLMSHPFLCRVSALPIRVRSLATSPTPPPAPHPYLLHQHPHAPVAPTPTRATLSPAPHTHALPHALARAHPARPRPHPYTRPPPPTPAPAGEEGPGSYLGDLCPAAHASQ